MKTLLLTGYESSSTKALENEGDRLRVDAQIARLEAMKFEVVVVMGGDSAESLLRLSKSIERCEIVFDTHGTETNLITNLQAGLFSTEEAVFALPSNVDIPDQVSFHHMINSYYRAGLRTETHGFWFNDYPLLVTRSGNEFFRKASDLKDFAHPALKLVTVEDANLATRVKTL